MDLKLDLLRLYRKIQRDQLFVVSNAHKQLGLSLNRAYPSTLHLHRGVTRKFTQTLYKAARCINTYGHVDELQHIIKDHHDVAVTMDSSHFFRICGDLQMESEFIEIRYGYSFLILLGVV